MKSDRMISGGYSISKLDSEIESFDLGLERLRYSAAHDHNPRSYCPGSWALSWVQDLQSERERLIDLFGIAPSKRKEFAAYANAMFDKAFGAWGVFFRLQAARECISTFLPANDKARDLLGLAIPTACVDSFLDAAERLEGGLGPGGRVTAVKLNERPEGGGVCLGYEVLAYEPGCLNSVYSLHGPEEEFLSRSSLVANENGLLSSFEDAAVVARLANDEFAGDASYWLPWAIIKYPECETRPRSR